MFRTYVIIFMKSCTKLPDPRNADIKIHVGGELLSRDQAKVSVFDSVVQGGDAVWEGLRVYEDRIFQLDAHLDRLIDSAKAMAYTDIPSREDIKQAIFETLRANDMRDGVHIRLTLTRGMKVTSGMSPYWNQYGSCLIVLPEWKPPVYSTEGVRLVTASVRRNPPHCIDSKIHHNNLINNILAKIEANVAGVDDAVMLDIFGFVSETNATNLSSSKKASWSPHTPTAASRVLHEASSSTPLAMPASTSLNGTSPCRRSMRPTKPSPRARWVSSAPYSKSTAARLARGIQDP